jgi:hypothetical protein
MKELLTAKELGDYLMKMDAVNLQGVWPTFPAVSSAGKGKIAAWLYDYLRRQRREFDKLPEEKRKEVVQSIIDRLENEETEDLLSLIA